MHKALQLQHEVAKHKGAKVNLGAVKVPDGYAIKKHEYGYFFVCWDGEISDFTDKKTALKWAKANATHKRGSWK